MIAVFVAACVDTGNDVRESTSEAAEGTMTEGTEASVVILPGPIFNQGSGLCLGIHGSSAQSGAEAVIGDCNDNSDTQRWRTGDTTHVGGVFGWQLVNGVEKCLGVQGRSTTSGAHVVQVTCGSTADHSQIWRPLTSRNGTLEPPPEDPGPGTYWLFNGHSGLCLGVHRSGTFNGALVVQGFCDPSSTTQQWELGFRNP